MTKNKTIRNDDAMINDGEEAGVSITPGAPGAPVHICMHRVGTARTDYRLMRDATALVAAGYQVTIVDVEGDRRRPREEDIEGVHLKHLITPGWFVRTRFKPWFLVKMTYMVIRGVVRLWQTPADVYHAHVDKALPACYIVSRLRHTLLIFDAPEMPISEPTIKRWRILYAMTAYLFKKMLQRCQGVLVTSSPTAEAMRKLYPEPKVAVVRNIPPYQQVQSRNSLRKALQLSAEQRIALYQGNIQPNRELERLVYAARVVEPGIVIVMMGQSVGNTRARLEALIIQEQVEDRVKFLPPVPYQDLLEWTASADIGLTIFSPDYSPNIRMTLPNKFFEYLMAGLPVLSTPIEAIAKLIADYDVGRVVHSLAPAAIGEAINTMLADSSALERMRANALTTARQEFHWEKESQKLLAFYHEILEEDHRENSYRQARL